MDVLTTPAEMRAWRRARAGRSLGFVPTMGYLHEGHLALVRRAREENELAVASIFVNPTQFGPHEDFARYPRDEARDLRLLGDTRVDAVYLPTVEAMYADGFQTSVTVADVSRGLEGAARPGHFAGVATVVLKLFHAVEPDRAYFGRKDAQQLRVVQRMVRDLDLAVEIVPCAIVRESDGLAMSSRNVYLSPGQRAEAVALSGALAAARASFARGEREAGRIRAAAEKELGDLREGTLEYISLADDETLEEVEGCLERPAVLSLVVRFGGTRLLDNTELPPVDEGAEARL